jgi:hypothetical protein
MSNAPDSAECDRPTIYPTQLFPWPTPVALDTGDHVSVRLDGTLMRQDYIWTWRTLVLDQRGREKAAFTQSTFYGWPVSQATLRSRASSTVPELSEDGRAARFVLEAMHEGVPIGEIARRIATEFGGRFARPNDALRFVADLSRRYC